MWLNAGEAVPDVTQLVPRHPWEVTHRCLPQLSQLATRLSVRGLRAIWNSNWWSMNYLALPYNSLVGPMASSPFWSIATCFSMYALKLPLFLTLLWSVLDSSSGVSKLLEEVRRCFRLRLCNLSKYMRSKKTMNDCSVIATPNPRYCSICKDKLTHERAGRNSGSSLKKIMSFDKPLEEKLWGTASYQI